MSKARYIYGNGQPYLKPGELAGKLIVVEGTDGVGRSTQIAEIKQWLEIPARKYSVVVRLWSFVQVQT